MKKYISLILLTVFSTQICLFADAETDASPQSAQEALPSTEPSTPAIQNTQAVSREPKGNAAAQSSRTGRSTSWQNWVFASAALCIAAAGVIVVAINNGHDNPSAQ